MALPSRWVEKSEIEIQMEKRRVGEVVRPSGSVNGKGYRGHGLTAEILMIKTEALYLVYG